MTREKEGHLLAMKRLTQHPPNVKPPRDVNPPGDVKPPLAFDPNRGKGKTKVAIDLNPATYESYGVNNTIRRAGLRLWDNDIPNGIESPDPLEFCDPINIGDAIAISRRNARYLKEQQEGISTADESYGELASLFDTTKTDRNYITVYGYAASIDDAIQRIAERAEGFPKRAPGENPVLCCCIGHGAQALWAHPSIQRLVRLRKQELRLDWKEKAAKKVITELLKGFGSENGSAPGPSKKQRAIQVPESFANVFGMISTETKLAQSPLACISIMTTLCNQPDVQREDRKIFSILVRDFVSTIHYRTFAAETLLNNPEWKRICKDPKKS
jgi:hypothetical protein